jgi:hypothetical protein
MRTWVPLVVAAACGPAPSPDDTDATSVVEGDSDTDIDTDSDTDTTITDPCLMPAAVVELGTGDIEINYRAIQTGDPVTMVHGPQGGWHIDVAATIRSPTPDVSFHSVVTDEAGNQLSGSQPADLLALASYDPVTCEGLVYGRRALLLDYTPPVGGLQEFICSLEFTVLTIDVDVVELATGATTEGTMTPSAALDPADEPLCH